MKYIRMPLLIVGLAMPLSAANDAYYHYLRGLVEERAGHTDKALEAYEQVIQADPQALQAYRDIAELRLRLGQADAALIAAKHVQELAPQDPTSFLFLGNVLVAQGDLAKAAEAYEKALQLDPANPRALENLGNYYAMMDPDKALSYYQRYLDLNPRDAEVYFQMGLLHQKRGAREKAIPLYRKSLDLDPDQLVSHLALAEIYEEQKSTAAAIAEYATASALQPASPLILMRLGHLYYRTQQWDDAWKTFKLVEPMTPKESSLFYWMARVAEEKKMWKDAAAYAEKAYELSKDPQFLPLAAYYLTLDRQMEKAIPYLEKAKEGESPNANVFLFLGMNYLDLNKPEKAREELLAGVSLYPKDAQMRFQLAVAEDRLGHFEEAVREFQTLLTLDPQHVAAMNYLGYSWAEKGIRLEEAEALLRKAVAADPGSGAFLDSLGWVRLKRGDAAEARHLLEKAAILSPDALIFSHLGDAAQADHHIEAALQAWAKALALEPTNETFRKKMQQESAAYLKSSNGASYLKYMEGNLLQLRTLQGGLSFKGKLNKRDLGAEGRLAYAKPDHLEVAVQGNGKSAPMQFVLHGVSQRVQPANTNPVLSQMTFQGMSALAQFLSAKMTNRLEVRLDERSGIQIHFTHANPSGGQDDVGVLDYDFIDGLWVPSVIRIVNRTIGWEAHVRLMESVVNQEHAEELTAP